MSHSERQYNTILLELDLFRIMATVRSDGYLEPNNRPAYLTSLQWVLMYE
jgi:hypothetical protein